MRLYRHRFGIVHNIPHMRKGPQAVRTGPGADGSGQGLSLQARRQRRVVGAQVEQVVRRRR